MGKKKKSTAYKIPEDISAAMEHIAGLAGATEKKLSLCLQYEALVALEKISNQLKK